MATKEEILQTVRLMAAQNVISKAELDAAYDAGSGIKTDAVVAHKIGISEILYYIGGAIVVLGIAILLAQNWETLGFVAKLLATLGAGVAAYIVGLLFQRD